MVTSLQTSGNGNGSSWTKKIDCRVKYGFTSKRGFDASQVQEWKSLKRVAIEASHMNSFGAEWVCFIMGKASFTPQRMKR